ncbi:MAG: IscA/HesB family protein [Desulfobulbaceae bacterium]
MIEISPLAAEKLTAYLTENNIESAVRIAAMNGCGGPSLGLALDERKDADHVLADGRLILVIDQRLSRTCGVVKVDYRDQTSGCGCGGGAGFTLTSTSPLPQAGGGCGGSCASSCGC